MTVSTTANKITYVGDGATTVFPYTFANPSASDILVYFTDADGVITDVTSAATITVNAAIAPNPTPVGGQVTYNPSGSPIPLGTSLTIFRSLSDVQGTSLVNQGTLYPQVIEQSLDYLTMLNQQIEEINGRAIVVAPSDPDPLPLPPVAQRASQWAAFDSVGNMIAATAPSGGVPISTAMQPVVEAATLALARTAMGLGTMAVEGIGAALQDDGTGNVRFISTPVLDSINQSIVAGFHMQEHHASAAITYAAPAASTLFAGFGFYIYALTNNITISVNAGDAFRGMSNGVSLIIPAGSQVFISTDAVNTWYVRNVQAVGLGSALNLQINASVNASALTVSLKDRSGNDPSASSPILLAFRDATAANGDPVQRAITSALSITAPNGATFATVNATSFRLWVVLFDNAGTPVLGLYQSITGFAPIGTITPMDEGTPTSGVAIGAGSTAAQTYYTNGTVTTKAFRILGYLDFSSGQVTAGTWATAPDKIQLFGPGIKKPGDRMQLRRAESSAFATGTTVIPLDDTIPQITEGDQYLSRTIIPNAAANIIKIHTSGFYSSSAAGQGFTIAVFRDSTANAIAATAHAIAAGNQVDTIGLDKCVLANAATLTTFTLRAGNTSAGTTTFNGAIGARLLGGVAISYLEVEEIMA